MLIRAIPSLPSQPGVSELRAELVRKSLAAADAGQAP
jgi:hypothetical protein